MDKAKLTRLGKKLAFLLRHDKDYDFDEHGWRFADDLIKNHGFDRADLVYIVEHDDKARYEWNSDRSALRARQGHSVPVDVELERRSPPETLWHGTATRFLESIRREGLKPMTRLYVQLSPDMRTAETVGKRHGEPVVLEIETGRMARDGVEFFLSRNGVWLTKKVDPKYIGREF